MPTKEKEALLKEISGLKPEDKAFVLGYCSGVSKHKKAKSEEEKTSNSHKTANQ